MTRRALIAVVLGVAVRSRSPRNTMAAAANGFNAQFRTWAEAVNATEPETVSMREVAAWEPLPKVWRAVESLRRKWLMGCR